MAWPSGRRRPHSPEWEATRRFVRARSGGQCERIMDNLERCPLAAREVDHVIPWSSGGPDTPENAEDLCPDHHTEKTQHEARQALVYSRSRGTRPPERHPLDY